jgi:hypothetical protein
MTVRILTSTELRFRTMKILHITVLPSYQFISILIPSLTPGNHSSILQFYNFVLSRMESSWAWWLKLVILATQGVEI